MDLYNLINSPSVAQYLEKKKYQFTSQEAAYIIEHSEKLLLDEKHALFHELIETMPNCEVEVWYDGSYYDGSIEEPTNLHDALISKIQQEKECIKSMYENEGSFSVNVVDNSFYDNDGNAAIQAITEEERDYICALSDSSYSNIKQCFDALDKVPKDIINEIEIVLNPMSGMRGNQTITLNSQRKIKKFNTCRENLIIEYKASPNITFPFRKGDILRDIRKRAFEKIVYISTNGKNEDGAKNSELYYCYESYSYDVENVMELLNYDTYVLPKKADRYDRLQYQTLKTISMYYKKVIGLMEFMRLINYCHAAREVNCDEAILKKIGIKF